VGEISSTCLKLVRRALDLYRDLTQAMFRMNDLAFEELEEFNSTFKGLMVRARKRGAEVERRFNENEPRFRDIVSRGESLREKMIEYLSALRDAIVACVPKREKKPFEPPWKSVWVGPYRVLDREEKLWIQVNSINSLLEELTGRETGWYTPAIKHMESSEKVFEKAKREHLDAYRDYIVTDVHFLGLTLDQGRVTPVVDHVYYADKVVERFRHDFSPHELLAYVYEKLARGE